MLVSPIAEEPRGDGGLISFSVKNVDVKDVLLGLSRLSRSNIVFEQDLTGKVSVDLKEVTIEEALDSLAAPLGLEWSRSGRTIYVTKQKPQTRIFPLNYIPTRRKGENQVAASSGGGTTSSTSAAAAATTTGAAAAGGGQNAGFSQVKGEDETNLWEDVKTTLEKLLSPQGKSSINPMAGIVVVTDFPVHLERVGQYFAAVETSVRRQVVIQAEILEILLTDDFEYGIDISYLRNLGTFKGSKPGLFPKADPNRTTPPSADAGPKRTLISQLLNPGTGIFSIGLMDVNLSIVLDFLQTEGRLRTLSRPSVSALNNQKAIIKVATEEVFFEREPTVSTQSSTIAGGSKSQTVSIGVVLSVTPQIASDGYIIMDIHPSVTDLGVTRTSPDGTASRPVVDVRETNTVLRVRDGESIVIAGLVKTKDDRQVKRVPFLSDIPVLGVLFKQIDESKRNTELLIKITPRIVQTTP